MVVIFIILIPFVLFIFLEKASSSLDEAMRTNETLSDNGGYVKFALISTVVCYGLVLGIFLIKNDGPRRAINVETRADHGVIIIKQVKYLTYYRTTQAQLIYHINTPAEYLFLNCGDLRICYADALLRLAIVILTTIFLWRFNFSEPFQWEYYRKARRILGLIFTTAFLELGANWYSNQWVSDHFDHIDAPHYQNNNNYSYSMVMVFVIAISSLFYLYRQGVNNREEIDLTI